MSKNTPISPDKKALKAKIAKEKKEWSDLCGDLSSSNCLAFRKFIEDRLGPVPQAEAEPVSAVADGGHKLQWLHFTEGLWGKNAKCCMAVAPNPCGELYPSCGGYPPVGGINDLGTTVKVNRIISAKPSGPHGGWTDSDCALDYVVTEMDHASTDSQRAFWEAAIYVGLPVVSLVYSGGKSIHAIFRVNAPDRAAYDHAAQEIADLLKIFLPDPCTFHPSRFTRMAGAVRTKDGKRKAQKLLYMNSGAAVWSLTPEIRDLFKEFLRTVPPLPEKLRITQSWKVGQFSGDRTEEDVLRDEEWRARVRKLGIPWKLDLEVILDGMGWLKETMERGAETVYYCECPWIDEHSTDNGDRDSYFYDRGTSARLPYGFHCSHSTCQCNGRDIVEVLEMVKDDSPELWEEALLTEPPVTTLLPVLEEGKSGKKSCAVEIPAEFFRGPINDFDNANIFEFLFKDRLRFLHDCGRWIVWGVGGWNFDTTNCVLNMGEEIMRARMASCEEEGDRLKMKKTGDTPALKRMLEKAAARLSLADNRALYDNAPDLIGTVNGVWNAVSGAFRAALPSDKLLYRTGTGWDTAAQCPQWTQFLEEIHPDHPDITLFLQRWAGYCLTGHVTEHKMLILHGHGRNGKSTFVKTILAVLGSYGYSAPPSFITEASKTASANAPNAALIGTRKRRMTSMVETKASDLLDEGFVKMLVSGDPVSGRGMYDREVDNFVPTSKFILSTNHVPRIAETDEGIWSKLVLVPFKEHFTPEKIQARGNLDLLLRDEYPGILQWMAEGCRQWMDKGLNPPQSVADHTRAHRESQDLLGQFMASNCAAADGEQERVSLPQFYARYRAWCSETGCSAMSAITLNRRMKDRGYTAVKVRGTDFWNNLCLTEQEIA